eukprot:gene24058-9630_t
MVRNGSQWFTMVHNGSQWFAMVRNGSQWFTMVHNGSQWFTMVRNDLKPCGRSALPQERNFIALLRLVRCVQSEGDGKILFNASEAEPQTEVCPVTVCVTPAQASKLASTSLEVSVGNGVGFGTSLAESG